VAGSRFAFDEQYYRDIVAADLARGMNPAANAPSASSTTKETRPTGPHTSGLPIKRHVTTPGAWCTQA
jgi:hypothetical protein